MADVAASSTVSLKTIKLKSAKKTKSTKSAKSTKTTSAKGTKIPRVNSKRAQNHPSYSIMISEAIKDMNDKKGASNVAIQKHIASKYNLDAKSRVKINNALKNGVSNGSLIQISGTGAAGRFRNAPNRSKPTPVASKSATTSATTSSSKTITNSGKSTKSANSTKAKSKTVKKSVKKAPVKKNAIVSMAM